MGARRPDHNGSNVSSYGARDKPVKTKVVVCNPGFIWGGWGELVYNIQVAGEGATSRERNKTRVSCATCGATVAASYLKAHMARSRGISVPQTRGVDEVGGGPTTYVVSFPKVLQEVICPVPGFPAVAHITCILCQNFIFCHFISKVAVFQEEKELLPRSNMCRMHIPEGVLIRNRRMARCDSNTQMAAPRAARQWRHPILRPTL